uniref:C2H2-type domain-containing protein n=2 Tax=Anopheles albimanus TaxID=7167 RepID=A0A182FU85_ANOAL
MKGPRWICELCHVRLEDWYAFREQCLGSDEYLRFNMRQWSDNDPANKTPEEQEPSVVPDAAPSTEPNRGSSSLAHRRKSVFEWTVPDARGGQKVIVELVGDEGATSGTGNGHTAAANAQPNGGHPAIETPPMEDGSIGNQTSLSGPSPSEETVVASPDLDWSQEFRARVNSQMHILPGAPRPYECKICRSRFKRRNNLRRHIRANHADEIIVGESPAEEFYALRPAILAEQQQQQRQQEHQHQLHLQSSESTDPKAIADDGASDMNSKSLQPVYQCTLCPRSFKMPAHLAVHRKAHLQKDLRAKEASLDHQRQQQQQQHESPMMIPPVRTFGRKSDIEPCAIIQLSDDDDDEDINASQVSGAAGETEGQHGVFATANGTTNGYQDDEQADDGFDEDEGSLKEASLEPSSLAIVELGADDGQTEVIIPQDVDPWKMKKPDKQRATLPASSSSSTSPPPLLPPAAAAPPIVPRSRPGPLSSKRRHTTGGDENEQLQAPSGTPAMHQSAAPPSSKRATFLHACPISYRCHYCQENFPQEELLRLHLKTHSNNAPAPFRCGWCRKGFRYRQNYMIHVEKQTCRVQSTGTATTMASSTVELTNGGGGGGGGQTSSTVPRLVAKKRAW